MKYSVSQIKNICSAKCLGPHDDLNVNSLIFDTRSISNPSGAMFCAITTEAADGHAYIFDAYTRGVRIFMVEHMPKQADRMPDAVFLQVDSVLKAIEKLAKDCRDNVKVPVIAITGSQGKTVVKEMLFQGSDDQISRSPRSWNSRLGVPVSLTMADTDGSKAYAIEVGIDRPGDMAELQKIVRPDYGVFTGITSEHDAGFDSKEQKIREKLLLFSGVKKLFYNASDTDVDRLVKESLPTEKLVPVISEDFQTVDKLLAQAVAAELGIKNFKDSPAVTNRLEVHDGVNDCIMIYDAFTNDFESLKTSLDFLRRRASQFRSATVIMGEPFGHLDASKAEEYARAIADYGVKRLVVIGPEISKCQDIFAKYVDVESVASTDEFLSKYGINDFSSETILLFGGPCEEFRQVKRLLEDARHDTVLEVNLDAIVHNWNFYRSYLKPTTGMIAMVKASAYGIGSLEISKTLQAQGAAYLAVAVIDEGVELRRGGITMPIVVLNPVTTNYRALFHNRLEPSVFSLKELQTLVSEARKAGIKEFKAHIKLDTGMHRVGFLESEIPALLEALKDAPELRVASIFSHLATADCPDQPEYTQMQLDNFERMSSAIMAGLPYPVKRHILNTAGIMTHGECQYDMVRLGIGLYGISPLPDMPTDLRTVATLKSTIISIKHWPAGTTIGYARRGYLSRPSVIATVPIGYADGLDRHLSRGNASFVVNGHLCPTVGNICMDQCMIDITNVPDPALGDTVEIFGNQNPVESLAEILDTIPYELLTSVSPRVKRLYFRD